jgi:RecA-family ATPase
MFGGSVLPEGEGFEEGFRQFDEAGDDNVRQGPWHGGNGATPPPRYKQIDIGAWKGSVPPDPDYVVSGWLPRGQVTLFSGNGGAGKSTIELYGCCACVLGRPWLEQPVTMGPAIFIDAEEPVGVLHWRMDKIVRHYGIDYDELVPDLHLFSMVNEDPLMACVGKGGKLEYLQPYHELLQMAGDIKPVRIGVGNVSNLFAGNELDRSQVQQFMSAMGRIAIAGNSALVLLMHPSKAGQKDKDGQSGSTQWHNAARGRWYLETVKDEDNPDRSALRRLSCHKSQYAPEQNAIMLQWQEPGMYLPIRSNATTFEKAAAEQMADHVFLELVRRFFDQGRKCSDKPSRSFAPVLFEQEPEAKLASLRRKDLEQSMIRLFAANKIRMAISGKASRPDRTIAIQES